MNINFDNIIIKNFLSFKAATLNFNDFCGYVSIIGENHNPNDNAKSNGSGKSALFDALCWVLTGETIRGVKDVKNIFTEGDALIQLSFTLDNKEYEVTRTKGKSSTLKLIEDGKDISGKGIRDTETILSDRLGDIDSTLIGSIILLGQGMPNRFSNNTPSGRKEVLETLSKSNYMIEDLSERIAKRKEAIEGDIKENSDNKVVASINISNTRSWIEDNKKKIQEYSEMDNIHKSLEENIAKRDDISVYLSNTKAKCLVEENKLILLREEYITAKSELEKRITEDTKGLKAECDDLQDKIISTKAKIDILKSEIRKIQSIKDICPTCGQKIQGVHKPDTTEQERELSELLKICTEYTAQQNNTKSEIATRDNNIRESTRQTIEKLVNDGKKQKEYLDVLKREVEEKQKLFNEYNVNIETQKNQIQFYEHNKAELFQKNEDMSNSLSDWLNKQEEYERVGETLNRRLEISKKFSTIISRDFRGILLEDIIAYLNNIIARYSNTVFGHSNLNLVLDKNNLNIIYCEKQYESLSGGEKQKVDVIIQFALRYMLCNIMNFSSNIIVLDEVFDNCDIEGCDRIIKLISDELSDINTVFIITHHNSELQLPTDYDIIVRKGSDNISEIS